MTINDYEASGGFREELGVVRSIGQKLVTLQEYMNTRPGRLPERDAVRKVEAALLDLRNEIVLTRNMQEGITFDGTHGKEERLFDDIYSNAAALIGKPEPELRKMAEQVFATMLFHAAIKPGVSITTSTVVDTGRLEVEVNTLTRKPTTLRA